MKLTEAAEKGRKTLVPRIGAELYLPCKEGDKYGGCYRGMALVGAGAVDIEEERPDECTGEDYSDWFLDQWPWTAEDSETASPCTCADEVGSVAYLLTHLWDKHVPVAPNGPDIPGIEAVNDPWTFERITDWLRSIEPKDEK